MTTTRLWLEKLENTLIFEKRLEKLEMIYFLLYQQLEKVEISFIFHLFKLVHY